MDWIDSIQVFGEMVYAWIWGRCSAKRAEGGRVKPAETNLQTNRVIRKPDFTVMLITNVTLQETVIFRELRPLSDFSGMLAENVAVLE
jgi:hypothetical protein